MIRRWRTAVAFFLASVLMGCASEPARHDPGHYAGSLAQIEQQMTEACWRRGKVLVMQRSEASRIHSRRGYTVEDLRNAVCR